MSTPAAVASPIATDVSSGRGWLWLGVAVALAAILLDLAQMAMSVLTTPWYLPILGTLGAAFLLYSFVQRRTFGRLVVLAFFALLAVFEWWLLLGLTRLPAYAGPKVGEPFPDFTIQRADGAAFTQNDFTGPQNTVFVLFRGRW
jgi:hypothetical protein